MSWQIQLLSNDIEYIKKDETYQTNVISLTGSEFHKEPSGGYQEPEDDVLEQIYSADSDHGQFQWRVTSRRTGFNSFPDDIEEVELISAPESCETVNDPSFAILQDDGDSE